MKHFDNKTCGFCGNSYIPTGACSKYCSKRCKEEKRKELHKQRLLAEGKQFDKHGGSYGLKGKEHWCYKNGISRFEKEYRYIIKEQQKVCQYCGKDLQNVGSKYWCCHHINHNHKDNRLENLILLCKSCHQKEHKKHPKIA